MTDYASRSSQDYNSGLFPSAHFAMPHYSNGNHNHMNYSCYNGGQIPYQTMNTPCPATPNAYIPNQNTSPSPFYGPLSAASTPQYSFTDIRMPVLPSQSRSMPQTTYPPLSLSGHRHVQHHRIPNRDHAQLDNTETQDSPNEDTMRSEAIEPPLEGYPDVNEFDELMKRYVQDLSPKKQDKALIHAKRAANIRQVLIDKKTTNIESAQFRFWVKKMFTLQASDAKASSDRLKKICHEGKPVAVREKLFKILTRAHQKCQHGGRDKTSAQVRRVYSWVPKELISRFVKLCPTCQVRRGTVRGSPPHSDKTSPTEVDRNTKPPSDSLPPVRSRKNSASTKSERPGIEEMPVGEKGGPLAAYQQPQQNRWMTLDHAPSPASKKFDTGPPEMSHDEPYPFGSTGSMSMACTGTSSPHSLSRYSTVSTLANPASLAHSASYSSGYPTYDIKPDVRYL